MDPATGVIRGITLFVGCAVCDRYLNTRSVTTYRDGEPRVSLACRVQSHDDAVRDYLRPDEVEVTMQAARKSGRHQVRDAAMIVPKRANWLVCPLCPIPTNCDMRTAITWRLVGMIPEPFRTPSGT